MPVLIIEGFDDPFLPAALETFKHLGSRDRSLMAILPVAHNGDQTGDVFVDGLKGVFTWKLTIPWLRHQLTGEPLPYETGAVKTWARGESTGPRLRPDWPGPTLQEQWQLSAPIETAKPCPQRRLAQETSPSGQIAYRYDPSKPWRSEGGARGLAYVVVDAAGVRPGPVVQTWDCRQDVIRFVSPPVITAKRIIGRMHLTLNVQSSAPDTAFVAKLVDLDGSDRAVHITDGAATLQLPTSEARSSVPYNPGDARSVTIGFFPTEWVLAPGHRLGLWVSSSSFPMFSRHMNTSQPWYLETEPQTANQTLMLGGAKPAKLVLEVGE